MTDAKPILTVELDDVTFERFQQKYAEFQAAVKQTPEAWTALGEEVKGTAFDFEKMNLMLQEHQEKMNKILGATAKAGKEASFIGSVWNGVTSGSKIFFGNITKATVSLSKWAGLTSVFASIIGAGGLFGIDRLAASVSQGRRSSLGLGISYGEQQSFDTSFQRLGDPSALLEWMNNAQQNPEDRWSLGAVMGTAQEAERLSGMSTSAAVVEALPTIKRRVDKFPAMSFDQAAAAYGIPVDVARVIRNMPASELQDLIQSYRSGVRGMDLPPDVLKKWNDLDNMIDAAEGAISRAFVDQLSTLTPGVEKLTQTLTRLVEGGLREGGTIDKWLKSVAHGMENFAGTLQSKSFQDKVDAFIHEVDDIVHLIAQLGAMKRGGDKSFTGEDPSNEHESMWNRKINHMFGIHNSANDADETSPSSGRRAASGGQDGPSGQRDGDNPPAGGSDRLSVVGSAAAQGINKVDPRLRDVLHAASKDLPEGWTAQLFSGYRKGDPRFHGRGLASDVRLLDPKGNPIANYQNPETFRAYEHFAQSAKKYQTEKYPELDHDFRWGGYFGGGRGKYGAMDEMHFDLGLHGQMGGGTFEHGLTDAQRRMFPDADSQGMGNIDEWKHPPVQKVEAPAPPPLANRTLKNYMSAHPNIHHWTRRHSNPNIVVDAPSGMSAEQAVIH